MKRILFSTTLTILLSLVWVNSFANHIFGGELLYTNISGNNYAVTLTIYGDCSGSSFPTLATSTPEIYLYDNTTLRDSMKLGITGNGVNVSPVCAADDSNTTCNGGIYPGVTRFIYSDTMALPYTSANWKFVFEGKMGPLLLAGRSTQLTNINQDVASGSTLLYLEAKLNNATAPNSSPEYSTTPTPFYCINIPEQYNQGALDPDGDSLSFTLVPAIDGNTHSPVSYISPYTATSPISTDANNFTFSSLSGQMGFTPNATQDALVVCSVSEYRNGVLVGTSEREMAFIVLSSCQAGDATISAPQNINGAANDTTSTVLNVCVGTPSVSFTVQVTNSSSDSVTISDANIPPGANVNITANNGQNPQLSFNWNTASVPVGVYNLLVNYNDAHCPISSHESIAYTINIINPPTFSDTVLAPTACIHQAYIQYNLANGALPRTVSISQNGNVVATYSDNTGIIKDSLPAGNYTATIGAGNTLCPATFNFSVIDSGILPASVQQSSYCIGDTTTILVVNVPNDSTVVTWYDGAGNVLPAEPTFTAATTGTYTFYFTEQYAACRSLLDTVKVNVHPNPTITILDSASEVYCYGDVIHLAATGATSYTWTPKDQLLSDEQGYVSTRLYQPESFSVYGTDAYGCSDTASITFSNVARCCLFSYPTAFTPNNDGKNDAYRTIIYGNIIYYSIDIFDRWGNNVFHTNDPNKAWDGTYKGKPCAMDTYGFIVNAQCATGHVEKHHGNLTLVR